MGGTLEIRPRHSGTVLGTMVGDGGEKAVWVGAEEQATTREAKAAGAKKGEVKGANGEVMRRRTKGLGLPLERKEHRRRKHSDRSEWRAGEG